MQKGKSGMGSHKHGISGHSSRSPAYKLQQTREHNRLLEEERSKRPKTKHFPTLKEALKSSS